MVGLRLVVGYDPLSRKSALTSILTVLSLRGFDAFTYYDGNGRWWDKEEQAFISENNLIVEVFTDREKLPALEETYRRIGGVLLQKEVLISELGHGWCAKSAGPWKE